MNIKEAKVQIKNAMAAYFTRDDYDNFSIPIERQRPVFLMGAPGIGKTAIMEQIAQELGVALVSYSMTHHTRQSALGLPFIVRKTYGGVEYDVSEYTMSEIIATVYETMEKTGLKQGILFLDEINCVSETLAPSMLQFLQFKIFGRHRVPDGWIVVTAGNPPEYNKSVREFDVVTLDRLKRMDDVLIVVSVSGRNAVPIEMAKVAKEKGVKVIAVTGYEYTKSVEPRHPGGKNMYAYADVVLDNKAKAGDAILEAEGCPAKFCPVSGITTTAVLQCLVAETIEQLLKRGVTPPVFMAQNLDGGEEFNNRMFKTYKDKIFYLKPE